MSDENTPPLSATERERRRRAVRIVRGSHALDGFYPDEEELAEDEEYINGTATLDELIERARVKYSAHSGPEGQQKSRGRAKTPLLIAGVLVLACVPGLLAGLVWRLWLAH